MPRFVPAEELFKGRHFDQVIVVLCVRWYISFKLSYRNLVAMMAERGIELAHTTILRWVQHYTPGVREALEPLCPARWCLMALRRNLCQGEGEWVYLDRAVDKTGKTVDFHLSRKRDVNAAKALPA